MATLTYLRESPLASILETCAGAPCKDFAPGAVLISEGETTGRLYILAEGSVEVLRGDTQVAVVGDPGAVFGEMSALLNRPHTATVKALTSGKVFVFYCNGAWRSALAADTAQQMGLEPVCEMDGGFTAWKSAGFPVAERARKA